MMVLVSVACALFSVLAPTLLKELEMHTTILDCYLLIIHVVLDKDSVSEIVIIFHPIQSRLNWEILPVSC